MNSVTLVAVVNSGMRVSVQVGVNGDIYSKEHINSFVNHYEAREKVILVQQTLDWVKQLQIGANRPYAPLDDIFDERW